MSFLSGERSAPSPMDQTPDQTTPARHDLVSIQYLRAVAAIAVLIFHAADRMGWRFGVGAAGVDIFFVISGFIMWVIGSRRSPTPATFLLRRAERIVPLYWLVTLALAGTWLVAPRLFPHLQPTPRHVVLSLLFVPHADPSGLIAPLVEPGWTLTYEVFFYIVFAATLAAPSRWRLAVLTGALASLTALGAVIGSTNPIMQTYTHPLLLEFLAGVWIGQAWSRGVGLPWWTCMLMLASGVVALGAADLALLDVERWRTVLWGGPAVLIVGGALGLERLGRWPHWRIPKLLGDASYSIYLVHGLAIAAALRIAPAVLGNARAPIFVALVAAGLFGGVVCYLAVERPLTRALQRRASSQAFPTRPSKLGA